MLTDLDLARACADCYVRGARWDRSLDVDDVHVNLRHVKGVDVIAFRGSADLEDWLRDFRGWPHHHPLLGWCHQGFLEGMEVVAAKLNRLLPNGKRAITGHSLGAAHALILAGLFTAWGIRPAMVVTFGTPRPGMRKLSRILNNGGYPIRHYRNGSDPVTQVPVAIPFLWPYRKPQRDLPLRVPPAAHPELPSRWHSMTLYLQGITAHAGKP